MGGLQKFGEYLWEFFAVTIIAAIAALTLIPFFPVMTGLTAYFSRDREDRRLRDIFTETGKNYKLVIPFTLLELAMIIFPVLNIYYFNTHTENLNAFVLGASYVLLVLGCFLAITAPTIIVNMNVKFIQLLRNCLTLFSAGIANGIGAAVCAAAIVAAVLMYPYVAVLTLYAVPLAVTKLMRENFLKLKAKALGTSVYELKRAEKQDDYLDEYGRIRREPAADSRDGEIEDEKK